MGDFRKDFLWVLHAVSEVDFAVSCERAFFMGTWCSLKCPPSWSTISASLMIHYDLFGPIWRPPYSTGSLPTSRHTLPFAVCTSVNAPLVSDLSVLAQQVNTETRLWNDFPKPELSLLSEASQASCPLCQNVQHTLSNWQGETNQAKSTSLITSLVLGQQLSSLSHCSSCSSWESSSLWTSNHRQILLLQWLGSYF